MALVLPSKKIQALIIIVLALFVAYFLSTLDVRSWVSSFFNTEEKNTSTSLESVNIANIPSDLDTDKDGLKDWQEVLWGSDKNNSDTDNDGVQDGAEIEKGNDPKIAGPDDSLEKTRGISASSVSSFSAGIASDPDNLSQEVSKDLFAKFMSLQSNGQLTSDTQTDLINSVISDIDPGSIPPRYTISDITIVASDKVTLRAYGNAVASVLLALDASTKKVSTNEASLASYESAILKLKNMKVPSSLGFTHLQLLNNFNASYQMLTLIANYQADPVKGLVAMKSLQANTQNAVTLFQNIASEFKNNAIIFETNESGNIWNNY